MNKWDIIARNKRFVLGVLKIAGQLPSDRIYDPIVRQLIRSSTSVGANYRAVCRAKSDADFINKLKIVEEEADESAYFLDLLLELNKDKNRAELVHLLNEADELTAIYVASINTKRRKM